MKNIRVLRDQVPFEKEFQKKKKNLRSISNPNKKRISFKIENYQLTVIIWNNNNNSDQLCWDSGYHMKIVIIEVYLLMTRYDHAW